MDAFCHSTCTSSVIPYRHLNELHLALQVRILVKRDELTFEGIKQFYVNVEREEWKLDTLCNLYQTLAITQSVIYANTKRKVHRNSSDMLHAFTPLQCRTANMPKGVAYVPAGTFAAYVGLPAASWVRAGDRFRA